MSALRALRQVSSSSSRVLLARNAGPLSRNQLAAFAVRAAPTMMKRTLSVSARVHGEGSSQYRSLVFIRRRLISVFAPAFAKIFTSSRRYPVAEIAGRVVV